MAFQIGGAGIAPNLVAAPMAGISDNAYRVLAKHFGCGLVCTEMVSSEALVRGGAKTQHLLRFNEEQRPISVQLFGAKPAVMGEAAAILNSYGFDLIDINLGCSVPKVMKSGSGIALMREPELLSEILSSVVNAANVPVTVKIRSGYDRKSPDCIFIAKLVEDFGASAITVHPRFGVERFRGNADWSLIAKVKQAVKIPVIGNGDIDGPKAALRMFEETGCDAVMVGRAALGDPWIFKSIADALNGETGASDKQSLQEVGKTLLVHYHLSTIECVGDPVRKFRKFAAWYSHRFPGASGFRSWINTISTEPAFKAAVADFFGVTITR